MSTYYSVYAEANVDGKWYSLCPYFRIDKDKDLKTHSIFWAQSLFWEVHNELEDHAILRLAQELFLFPSCTVIYFPETEMTRPVWVLLLVDLSLKLYITCQPTDGLTPRFLKRLCFL